MMTLARTIGTLKTSHRSQSCNHQLFTFTGDQATFCFAIRRATTVGGRPTQHTGVHAC